MLAPTGLHSTLPLLEQGKAWYEVVEVRLQGSTVVGSVICAGLSRGALSLRRWGTSQTLR